MLDLLLQLLAGWLLADFLSGLFHWIEDRLLFARDTWIGRLIVLPNRLHHREPAAFLAGSFVDRNWTTWILMVPAAALWLFIAGPSFILLGALCGGLLVNEVHRLAHRSPERGSWLRVLQEVGLVQSAAHHAGHHRTEDRRYCILTDWLNPVLDKIGVWHGLERLLVALRVPVSLGT